MSRLIHTAAFVLLALTTIGCFFSSSSCEIGYRNDSDKLIWVENVAGLGADPVSCGALTSSKDKSGADASIMGLAPKRLLPETVNIEWWVDAKARPDDPTKVFRADVSMPKSLPANHRLLFVYSADGKWSASVEKLN